ncbi:hypothetical protein ASE14_07880 [Agromyces sp. Root81]|nr:hypothetical protein ASE14_07880 [Agromyces sp. Root81]
MSAMTAMELGPQNSATYENFADTIDQVTERAASEDLKEMFGRVALTVLVGNVDDHWKNHGFTRELTGRPAGTTTWRLSPLFDVNPTRSGSVVRSRRINERDDASNRDLRQLIAGRVIHRLGRDDALGSSRARRCAPAEVPGAVRRRRRFAGRRRADRADSARARAMSDCPACGNWICNECSAERRYASRFSREAQSCSKCGSHAGHMAPAPHRGVRADDHSSSYRLLVAGATP